jgi:hypothetical protein
MPDAHTPPRVSDYDLLRAVALVLDERLVPNEHDCEDLYARGLVKLSRDITDEHVTELTPLTADLVRDALSRQSPRRRDFASDPARDRAVDATDLVTITGAEYLQTRRRLADLEQIVSAPRRPSGDIA